MRTEQSQVEMWQSLNKRQQTYLQAVYEVDQAIEASRRHWAARGRWSSTKAAEWRWMPYNAVGAALLRKIQEAGYQDRGTGSTFAALERRGLVLCKYEPGSLGGPILCVQITKAGRRLVREALHLKKAPKALPGGTLREWHWRALALAWQSRPAGVRCESGSYGHIGWNTWLRLRDDKVGALIEEYQTWQQVEDESSGKLWHEPHAVSWLRLTPCGERFYRQHWQRYRELYPDVDAPEPPS